MFVDLDNFKPYNDTYGHEIGDIVLQGMARIFDESIGKNGFVSRYGGDEFIIISYTNDKVQIEQIVKSIYEKIDLVNCLKARKVYGGPAPETVKKQIENIKVEIK